MLPIIWMSPWNSYFKDIEVAYLLKETIKKYNKAVILVADEPAISTYLAMWYNFSKARNKAILKWNNLKNRTKKVISSLGLWGENIIIVDWENEIKNNLDYLEKFKKVNVLYENNLKFRESVNETSKTVILKDWKTITEAEIKQATYYLLSEIAFLEFSVKYFNVDKISYVYHKNWRVFEDYIAWIFDEKIKNHLDFILIENPYEKYFLLEDKKYSRFDAIVKSKSLKVTFSPYFDLFEELWDWKYSWLFFDIINFISKKEWFKLDFVEKSWYWIIWERLNTWFADIFCSPVWPTKDRKLNMFFSESIFESKIFAYINSNSKFCNSKLEDLFNNREIRIAVKENDIHHDLAKNFFPNARLVWIPQLSSIDNILNFVKDNRADMTFWDGELVWKYLLRNNYSKHLFVKKWFGYNPIITYQNCIALPWWEFELKKIIDLWIQDYLKSLKS